MHKAQRTTSHQLDNDSTMHKYIQNLDLLVQEDEEQDHQQQPVSHDVQQERVQSIPTHEQVQEVVERVDGANYVIDPDIHYKTDHNNHNNNSQHQPSTTRHVTSETSGHERLQDDNGYNNEYKHDEDSESDNIDNNEDIDGLNPYGIPGIPALPSGVDPKKMCPFCQKTFSHPGSMGRHLDLKKGTKLHPVDLIEKMRSDVKRRGDLEKIKERRRLRSKRYYDKVEVKERTKVQRRGRDKLLRAKKQYINLFYEKLGRPELDNDPSFPRLVLYFLSPTNWPSEPPTLETYKLLCEVLNEKFLPNEEENAKMYVETMQKLHTASEQWLVSSDSIKQEIWTRELRQAAIDSLTNFSLYDLKYRDDWVLNCAKERIKNGDEFYNEEELAAVAEAVVNKDLDPELIK